jgi:hypothetical protein
MYDGLIRIARDEYGDVVIAWRLFYRRANIPLKLRLFVRDGTFVDIHLNPTGSIVALILPDFLQ